MSCVNSETRGLVQGEADESLIVYYHGSDAVVNINGSLSPARLNYSACNSVRKRRSSDTSSPRPSSSRPKHRLRGLLPATRYRLHVRQPAINQTYACQQSDHDLHGQNTIVVGRKRPKGCTCLTGRQVLLPAPSAEDHFDPPETAPTPSHPWWVI